MDYFVNEHLVLKVLDAQVFSKFAQLKVILLLPLIAKSCHRLLNNICTKENKEKFGLITFLRSERETGEVYLCSLRILQ